MFEMILMYYILYNITRFPVFVFTVYHSHVCHVVLFSQNMNKLLIKDFNVYLLYQRGYSEKSETGILTHLAYIANGKKRVILCNNFTGRISVTLLCGICDVSYPTKQR